MLQRTLQSLTHPALIVFYLYTLSVLYIHFRGKVRLRFARQFTEHSGILAPYNSLMYLFSAVPKDPILPTGDFPELAPLRVNWQVIRDEAKALWEGDRIRPSDRHDDLAFMAFYKRGWKRFYLKWYDDPMPSAAVACPRTVDLVQSIPSVKSAAFTLLPPGSVLGKHRDPFAGSLRYHLGLITPNSDQCSIWVDGVQHSWRDGQDVVFDETYVHWAENHTDHTRIILFCDLTRPLHTPFVRGLNSLMARFVIKATKSANEEGEKVGLLNRITPVLYGVKAKLEAFKRRRRRAYYGAKWLFIGALAYLLLIRPLELF
ncbi:MAG TPA: aspartyl/asparaginyl beta-hydroxylase domain-containing protein [Thermoanaerobaculia bacterium]|nr:aspartyl/asparaginyl beta-hydroxylase domain-containing protein [Thermoanaerobaculia bacterium]